MTGDLSKVATVYSRHLLSGDHRQEMYVVARDKWTLPSRLPAQSLRIEMDLEGETKQSASSRRNTVVKINLPRP